MLRGNKWKVREAPGIRGLCYPSIVFLANSCLELMAAIPFRGSLLSFTITTTTSYYLTPGQLPLFMSPPWPLLTSLFYHNPPILWLGQMSPRWEMRLTHNKIIAEPGLEMKSPELFWKHKALYYVWIWIWQKHLKFWTGCGQKTNLSICCLCFLTGKPTYLCNDRLSQGWWALLQLKREKNPSPTIIYSI